ncbi:MAG: hypothetical protein U9R20_01465 [Thermodesulfobacteriota bacterium]|nr:hypothetical protein [Thermodesulfobacteriota bacterium]
MKMLKIVMVALVISLMLPVGFALGYGGDGDGDGDSADAFVADDSFGGGAVSWGGHPDYPNVRGSSVWDCNPVGPFQEGTAIQDSVQDLIDGYQDGRYTKDDVKNSLDWAEGVGISLDNTRRDDLVTLMNPPPPKNSEDEKVADQIEMGLNMWAAYNETKKNNGGKPPSKLQIGASVAKKGIKQYVPSEYHGWVDDAFDLVGL